MNGRDNGVTRAINTSEFIVCHASIALHTETWGKS